MTTTGSFDLVALAKKRKDARMNKLLSIAGTVLLVIVGLTRLQIVNGHRTGNHGVESTRYISFR